jgi:hypothetical protein
MTPTFRSATAIAVTVGLAALLTACFPVGSASEPTPSESAASTGLSREAAAELLNAVPGISSASVGSETVVKVSVDDQSSILADGVLDYVLQIGWATMVPNEPTELSLTVRSNGTTLDLQAQANDLAGVDSQSSPLPFSAYLDAPGDYLGAWPGAVPAPPAG